MTEFMYLFRLCNYALGFLLFGILLGSLGLSPEIRFLTGLPEDAVHRALEAEIQFDQNFPGQGSVAASWSFALESAPVQAGDITVAIDSSFMNFTGKLWRAMKPWLGMVGIRSTILLAVVVSSLPLLLSVWLLGRRQACVLFHRGVPATDAQRTAWVSMAGLVVVILGVLISVPISVSMTPWLFSMTLAGIALMYPIRAVTTARI